ncbi:MAG: polymorphic toxin type 33 domain-containing protein [Candidatus Gracilibacteria bacterium]|nr:polymorphic toxin type 33 domain-containing protein [Candidatus Gracilibacteria bacterium]
MGNINNVTLGTKIILKIVVFLIGFWFSFGLVNAAVIESTSIGGNWASTSTWIGGVVPGVGDDVVIKGVINISTSNITINNLTINNQGKLSKLGYSGIYYFTVNGDLLNNGSIGGINQTNNMNFKFSIKGKLFNYGIISYINDFYLYNDLLNYGILDLNIKLGNSLKILNKVEFYKTIFLNGYTLYVPKDSYLYAVIGPGNLNSGSNENGNNENVYLGTTSLNLVTNFEYLYLGNNLYSLTGRNIVIGGNIDIKQNITINGNLIIKQGVSLKKHESNYNYIINVNGNFENNGTYGTEVTNYNNNNKLYISGNFKNNGNILGSGKIYIYGGFDSIIGNIISTGVYLTWNSLPIYNKYNIDILGLGIYQTNVTQYGLSANLMLEQTNLYWKWSPFTTENIEWSDSYCINVPGCIKSLLNNGPIKYNPSNLIENNSNPICSQNISSGPLIFDISKLDLKTKETEKLTTTSEYSSKGDPVMLSTGEFDYENTLMSYAGINLPFEFKIRYKNQAYYNGPIGNNFDYNYNIYLTQDENGNINIHDGKLGVFKFTSSGSTFERNETIKANLELVNNKYEISFDDKTKYIFGDNFKIEKIVDTYGNNLSFTYNSDFQLTKITDTLNREYNLSYYGNSRLYKIVDFTGYEVEFIYFNENESEGSQFDLKTIKMINGNSEKEISFTYTIGTDFESSHNIVKLIDSANNTYVENTYDSFDRVSSQTYGNGTIYYDYNIDTNNKITKNSVTDREGNVIDYFYDNFGNTIKKVIKKTSGDLEYNYEYDSNNNLIKEIKPLGNGVLYNYDINNNLIEKRVVQDTTSSGSIDDIVINYTYDLLTNKPTQIIEPNGLITNLVYDTNNNLVSKEVVGVKDYNGNNININESFTYNGSGQLVSQTNAGGLETSFEYIAGNLSKITKGTGSLAIENSFVYDTKGNMTKIIDGKGNETNLTYDDFNLLISKTTSEGIVNEIIYNSLNKKTSEKIVLGTNEEVNTSYNYDILDNLTQTTTEVDLGVNLITNYIYDTNSRIIETSSGSGAVENIVYDENALVLSKTISYGNNDVTTNYTYDLNERLIKQINPNGSEINFEYDLFDRIIKKINPDNSYTTYTYDKSNNIIKQEIYDENDNLLSKQEFVYDKQNRAIETKNHILPNDIIITKTKYDSLGNIIKTIDAKGNETNYTYDIFSRLVQVEDSLGNIVQNSYDKNDNLVEKKIISSANKTITTNYTYDSDNRLISETNSLNKTKTYTYNKLNQVISKTDEEGNITNFTYTYTGKVKTETLISNSGNKTTTYTYDSLGNMLSITDSEGNITNYEYDILNRLVKQIYADNKELNYEYDTNNNLVQKTDPNGTIINYTYDSQNRLISKNITNGNGIIGITNETYSYDELGRLVEANDSNNHKLQFSYDSLGRMITETQSGSLVSYDYDNNNNLTSITNPNNKTTNYTYDNLNRITNIGYDSNNIATYNYTGLENTSLIYTNNTSIVKTYDNLSRINSLNNEVNNYNYTYDDVNNITSDNIKNYLYDDIYRLKEVQNNVNQNLLESFKYDNVGNRINSFNLNTGSGASYDYETNILNQYTTLSGTTLSGSLNYTYDNNGNLKNDGEKTFSYDYKNRLTKVETSSGIIAQYSYDVLNRRYFKETEQETTEYIFSNENILTEKVTDLVNQTTTNKNYINGIGLDDLVAYVIDNNVYYYHKNHLGSIEGISDENGDIVVSYEYDSFGNAKITSGADIGNTILFTGREYDKEIGLYYLRARYYDANLGRFISRDPIGQVDDVNLYSYVGNNVMNYVDLMGTEKKSIPDKIMDVFDFIGDNKNRIQYEFGKTLLITGISITATTAPACISSISITGGCGIVTAPTGVGIIACSPVAITAGASCGATVAGAGVAGMGVYMMNSSDKNLGNYNFKQDKELNKGEIEKIKKGGYDIHNLKPKKDGSKYDLFKTKDGNIYFKRKTGKGNSEPTFIDLNINNF